MQAELLAKLEELKALCNTATRSPWRYDGMHNEITAPYDKEKYYLILSECRSAPDQEFWTKDEFGHKYDANFDLIAKGRNVLPAALEAAEVLVSLVAEHRNDCPKSSGYERCTCDQDEIQAAAARLLEALK